MTVWLCEWEGDIWMTIAIDMKFWFMQKIKLNISTVDQEHTATILKVVIKGPANIGHLAVKSYFVVYPYLVSRYCTALKYYYTILPGAVFPGLHNIFRPEKNSSLQFKYS